MFSRVYKPTLQLTKSSQSIFSRFASTSTESTTTKVGIESAQKVLGGAAEKSSQVWAATVKKAGDSLGAYKEPILGNAAVAREVLKQVYIREKLAPPTLAQISHTYSSFFNSTKNPTFWKNLIESGEWKRYGIYAIEAFGIFKLGEMIGRRHMVGYKLEEKVLDVAASH